MVTLSVIHVYNYYLRMIIVFQYSGECKYRPSMLINHISATKAIIVKEYPCTMLVG